MNNSSFSANKIGNLLSPISIFLVITLILFYQAESVSLWETILIIFFLVLSNVISKPKAQHFILGFVLLLTSYISVVVAPYLTHSPTSPDRSFEYLVFWTNFCFFAAIIIRRMITLNSIDTYTAPTEYAPNDINLDPYKEPVAKGLLLASVILSVSIYLLSTKIPNRDFEVGFREHFEFFGSIIAFILFLISSLIQPNPIHLVAATLVLLIFFTSLSIFLTIPAVILICILIIRNPYSNTPKTESATVPPSSNEHS